MIKSLERTLILMLVAGGICGGFVWGRSLSQRAGARHSLAALPPILRTQSANAGNAPIVTADARDFQEVGDANSDPADTFERVLDYVQREYVEGSGSDAKLSNGALTRMLASLNDPFTYYLEPDVSRATQDSLLGKFHGIGVVSAIQTSKKDDVTFAYITVISVMPNSPAEKAGMKSGDRITEFNGRWLISYGIGVDIDRILKTIKDPVKQREEAKKVSEKFQKGYNPYKALNQLITTEGKKIDLAVERTGTPTPIKMTLTTAITQVSPVEFKVLDNKIGYLRVRQFNGKATQMFHAALDAVPAGLKGLVIDLRQNFGGVKADPQTGLDGYNSALKLAGQLTGGATATIERKPKQREPLKIAAFGKKPGIPIAVLVDQGTANLSEMVASVLHDASGAKIVGTRTAGNSVLQLLTVFKNGAGVVMTTAHLLPVKGDEWNKGIEPDIAVTGDALPKAVSALGAGA